MLPRRPLQFLHLSHLEFHRRRTAEDGDRDLEPREPVVDFLDHAVEGGERPLGHPHLLAHLEGDRRPHNFSTCPISSSTRVGRPKIETATLSRERPSSTSSTTPLNDANGPSDTRTCSPTSNDTDGLGRSMPSWTWCRMRAASASEIGIGLLSAPRKPVTFGVFLMRWKASSVSSIFTST